jgi:hypothetical protein
MPSAATVPDPILRKWRLELMCPAFSIVTILPYLMVTEILETCCIGDEGMMMGAASGHAAAPPTR